MTQEAIEITEGIRQFDDPILKKICEDVGPAEDASDIIEAMREELRKHKDGIGLAAPQIGVPKRIVLIRNQVLINPIVTWESLVKSSGVEGCLSYPGVGAIVERPISIKVTFENENREEVVDKQFTYFEAVLAQHELDHLNGICKVGEHWEANKELYERDTE